MASAITSQLRGLIRCCFMNSDRLMIGRQTNEQNEMQE